ncbi:hypothetical protein NYD80_004351 [Cronobacter sakazakii]|nr:hypothetical protein [Cronobacter sakazakii]EJQ2917511.1 hypothetical protein [Cronobacter sakazakii]EJR0497829.1 hypothetical protein [Cronobacter sakazakii]
MKRYLLATALTLASISSNAFGNSDFNEPNPNNWVRLAASEDNGTIIYGKKGTYVKEKINRSFVIQYFLRDEGRTTYGVSFYKVSVSNKDCQNKYGKIVFSDLQGKPEFSGDYIEDGGSVGSMVADILCSIK